MNNEHTNTSKPHDKGYKKDLKKPSEFLHFLKKYVDAEWVKNLDVSQLRPCDKEFISKDYDGKEADILYEIHQKDGSYVYIFILQELQSSVDYTMIFRVLMYIMDVLTDYFMHIDKKVREKSDFKLPAIVPIVFYNGSDKWTAAQSLKEYMHSAELFGDYTLNLQYYLVDLNKIDEEYILNTNTLIDNIMYCDKFRKNQKLISAVQNAFHRVSQLGKQESEEFLNWSEHILLSICGNNSDKVKHILEIIRNGGNDMAFEYTIERVFREEKERISTESWNAGNAEGWKASKVESIIELLSEYGTLPIELTKKLHSENNIDVLRKWFKLSSKVSSIQEFMEKM